MDIATSRLMNEYCTTQGYTEVQSQEFQGLVNSCEENRKDMKEAQKQIENASKGEDIYSS